MPLADISKCLLKKNTHSFEVEDYLYSVDFMEDFSPRHCLSGSSEGLFQKNKGGARIYRSFC